jgi:hypothetical protein
LETCVGVPVSKRRPIHFKLIVVPERCEDLQEPFPGHIIAKDLFAPITSAH